jgi:hypothetical protein
MGLQTYGAQIGLSVVTAAKMSAAVAAFQSADSAASTANSNKAAQQAALNAARDGGYALASVVKRFVTDLPGFGTAPNAQWQELGFAAGSLEIPRKTVEVMLAKMATYLAAHPAIESAPRGITSANCADTAENIVNERGAVDAAHATYAGLKSAEDAAFKALGNLMSDLVKELKLHLSGDDARWYGFGLRRPDDPETPAAPHDLQLSSAGSGRVFCDWADVPGAQRYHVWLAQGEEKAVRVASVEDSEFMLQDLMVGTSVKVYIVASNEGGESVPSEIASIAVT